MGGSTHNYYFFSNWILKGDTIVNNKLYQKIYSAGNQNTIDTSCYAFTKYIIYNDSNKIYAGKRPDTMLLEYDFNLLKGDSFPIRGCYNNMPPVAKTYYPKVDSISTIFYAGRWRKKIRFSVLPYNTHISWIEGVGDGTYGLLVDYFSLMLFNSYGTPLCGFNCFYDGGNYSTNGTCTYRSCLITGVELNNLSMDHSNSTYPNPAGNFLYIINDQHGLEKAELEVWNYSGQLVLKQPFSNSINVSQLSSGLYTLIVYSKNSRYYSKFVKE